MQTYLRRLTWVFFLFIFTSFRLHDFHTSIARVDYNTKSKTFEVSLRVFTDDLEKVISRDNGKRKFTIVNNDKNDAFVETYVRKHFVLTNTKKQKISYDYIGKEQEADATWIYLEVPLPAGVAGLMLQNDIMLEEFDDQTNLVNLKYNATRKSYIFKKDETIQPLAL